MPFSSDVLSGDVTDRMGRAWRELRRGGSTAVVRDRLFGTGPDAVEPGQMDILDLLVQRDGWRMSELAAALRVDPSTVTRSVQRTELDGLARRVPACDDGRVVQVLITPEGRRRHGKVAARRAQILGEILAALPASDREQLVDLLERFIESLDDYVAADGRVPAR